ncbi:transcriptional regulator [Bacteroidia bacterium]|nr:transcriptional regulator [Bacteroidia bacterium]
MQTNNHAIRNYSAALAEQYGAHGTPERAQFDEEAYTFYTGQVMQDARKKVKLTQDALAHRMGVDKSYISRIERGDTVPSVSTFYRAMHSMGFHVTITPDRLNVQKYRRSVAV